VLEFYSDLHGDGGNLTYGFTWFTSVPPGKCRDNTNSAMTATFKTFQATPCVMQSHTSDTLNTRRYKINHKKWWWWWWRW